jgi:hypothetical protein
MRGFTAHFLIPPAGPYALHQLSQTKFTDEVHVRAPRLYLVHTAPTEMALWGRRGMQ